MASYILHDHIVGGDAITGNKKQRLLVNLVQVAHLAPGDKRESALQVKGRDSFRHGELSQLRVEKRESMSQCVIRGSHFLAGHRRSRPWSLRLLSAAYHNAPWYTSRAFVDSKTARLFGRWAIARQDATISDTVEDFSAVSDHSLHRWACAQLIRHRCVFLPDRGPVPSRSRR